MMSPRVPFDQALVTGVPRSQAVEQKLMLWRLVSEDRSKSKIGEIDFRVWWRSGAASMGNGSVQPAAASGGGGRIGPTIFAAGIAKV